jgi:hypothetical protein
MSRGRVVTLSAAQRGELLHLRDYHALPYVRERCAAILKVAGGRPVRQVASHGLLRPRREETVGAWIDRYLAEGQAGLAVRQGRGRKPAFSPLRADR